MNILSYMQFFDGIAEKNNGTFLMEKVSSKKCNFSTDGNPTTHACILQMGDLLIQSFGNSRKDALKTLYRKINQTANSH